MIGLLGSLSEWMWVCTFHSACARILRRDASLLGYRSNFTIYDEDDSTRLIKHCLEDLRLDIKRFPPRGVQSLISDAKNKLIDVDEFAQRGGSGEGSWDGGAAGSGEGLSGYLDIAAQVYRRYQARLLEQNALDFDDLLMRTVDILRLFPERLAYYRDQFRHVLVDEYQDTNRAQYLLVKLLTEEHRQATVVGDDDQSVYSWRGADIRNILSFEDDFPDAKVVKLEQNYRSSTTILDAANALVAHNRGRKPKNLWSDRGTGAGDGFRCRRARGGAAGVRGDRRTAARAPGLGCSCLLPGQRPVAGAGGHAGAPRVAYRVVGAPSPISGLEIKDLLAYLRVTMNAADDPSPLRVINTPRRGLGDGPSGACGLRCRAGDLCGKPAARRGDRHLTSGAVAARARLGESFVCWTAEAEQTRWRTGPPRSTKGLDRVPRAERTMEAEGRLENLEVGD